MSNLADSVLAPPLVRTNVAAIIATMEDHNARGVPITGDLAAAVPIICARLMKQDSPRMQATGAKLVLAALKHNLELVQQAGKESRLTNGDPTENHSVKFIRGVDGEGI